MTKTVMRSWFCRTISTAIALQTARGKALRELPGRGQSAPAVEVRVVVGIGSQDLVPPVSRMTLQEEKVEVVRHHRVGLGSVQELV